jgi:eukaryotic-like serine/threonine-protein kinase
VSYSVTLTVVEGRHPGQEFVYAERTTCILGRADDCAPQILDEGRTQLVSRHHCLIDINPPDVRIRDFGSLNGTHVNGEEIGRRRKGQTPEEGARLAFRERDLADGDTIRLGNTVMRVGVDMPVGPAPTRRYCGQCGRDVAPAAGGRLGDVICDVCRRDLDVVVNDLLGAAGRDNGTGGALRGYEIVRQLGRGGQGVVYLARHHDSGELTALKVLLPDVAVDTASRDSFLREIDSLRLLRHRNIVEFRAKGSAGAAFFLACEYCDGGSLADLLDRRGGQLPVAEAVDITLQMLDGLDHAHHVDVPGIGRGLVHRDVKPHNVLLTGSGPAPVAKLADFGLAKAFDQAGLSGHTRTGSVAGTVAYMSRAQLIDFKFARPAVDVWATAATLYRMLTGTTPREFPPSADPIAVVLRNPPVPIRQRGPSVPARLAAVIDEALVDQPRILVTEAAELRQAVLDAVQDRSM